MPESSVSEDGQTVESVTTVIRAHIKPDKNQEYEEWLYGINEDAAQFAGFQGGTVLRPEDESHQHPEYVIVVRFASYSDLRSWEHSTQFAEWRQRLEPLLVGDVAADTLTGTETWFTLPGHFVVVPPPQIQNDGSRYLRRRPIRAGGHTVAGRIPEWGIAIDRHIHSHLIGHVFCHDLGHHAAVDAVGTPLALSDFVNRLESQAARVETLAEDD